ncbi:MAG: hypothetical protein EP298_08920 [Gammaproteobacteria bacterium]|nr:MAG: hypothetical protein EP298_08920 [Gammaproteobacteria bacterium]UTW42394.1 hypothetical protein KFE69_13070 [bacterium SCSIO 12844]
MFEFLSLYNMKDQAFKFGSNFYAGLKAVANFPWDLYDLYHRPQVQPIARQLVFYHLVTFGSVIALNYLNQLVFPEPDDELDAMNQSISYQIANMASDALVVVAANAVVYVFPLTYGLATEINYSEQAMIENAKKERTIEACEHSSLNHIGQSLKLPLFFPISTIQSKLLSQIPYISLPVMTYTSLIQISAFEYNRDVCRGECPEKAFRSLESKNGFLLGQASAYMGLMGLFNFVMPAPLNAMFASMLYHSFSLATVFRKSDASKDDFNFHVIKSSEVLFEKTKDFIVWINKGKEPSDLPKRISRLLFEHMKLLRKILPLEPKWYNLPFHKALGIYKSTIDNSAGYLSIADQYGLLSMARFFFRASEKLALINKNGTRDFLLNKIDHDVLQSLLDDLSQALEGYQKDYSSDDQLIHYLLGHEYSNGVIIKRFTAGPIEINESFFRQSNNQKDDYVIVKNEGIPEAVFMQSYHQEGTQVTSTYEQ